MKKTLVLLLSVFLLLASLGFLSGCGYEGYSGDHLDLYTVAINSVLWNNGHSFSADRYTDSQIEILDEDRYGRTIFTYYEKYYAGGGISFSALIICQSSNEKEVFYYEDVNYIVKEQKHTPNLKEYEKEEIEQLKAANDWNREIDYDKCIKKEITRQKPAVPYEQDVENRIIDEFHLTGGNYSLFVHLLTTDSANSDFIIYGYVMSDGGDIYFVGLGEGDNESLKELKFLVPENVFDYKTAFVEFKKTNNWT